MQMHVLRSEINAECFPQSCSVFYLIIFFLLERVTQDPKHTKSASQQDTRIVSLLPSPVLALQVYSIMLIYSLLLMSYQFFKNFTQLTSLPQLLQDLPLFITHLTLSFKKIPRSPISASHIFLNALECG